MSGILKPFFEAVQSLGKPERNRYFLGFRIKSPGADLVLFRSDGVYSDGTPKGSASIFHYNGFNGYFGNDIPKLASVNNLRNTLLFEVSHDEYQAIEGQIDLMRIDARGTPYYFSRGLGVVIERERRFSPPVDYNGEIKPGYENDLCDHFERGEDDISMVAVNCVYLAIEMLKTNAGIDLAAIDPDLATATRGAELAPVFSQIREQIIAGTFLPQAGRTCLVFSQAGELAGIYKAAPNPSF